jgi:hypothetical protein
MTKWMELSEGEKERRYRAQELSNQKHWASERFKAMTPTEQIEDLKSHIDLMQDQLKAIEEYLNSIKMIAILAAGTCWLWIPLILRLSRILFSVRP